jgi:hypothetical protein
MRNQLQIASSQTTIKASIFRKPQGKGDADVWVTELWVSYRDNEMKKEHSRGRPLGHSGRE